MGFDPSGASEIVEQYEGEDVELEDFLFELDDLARRNNIAEMIRMANAVRAGRAENKSFDKWMRLQNRELQPKKKRTVWDRLRDRVAEERPPETVWSRMKKR